MKGQLKISNKDKKIKPIKQPVKVVRQNIEQSIKPEQYGLMQSKQSKNKNIVQSNKSHDLNLMNSKTICSDLLGNGHIQSFIDIFYISHNCLPNVLEKKNYYGEELHIPQIGQQKQENLQFLTQFSKTLLKTEHKPQSSRQQKQLSMNQYNSIAFNYEDQGNYITAAYFYQKVIQLASACKNKQYELIALLGLGKCFDQTNEKDKAIQLLQDAFDNASILQNQEQRNQLTKLIGKELIEIYIKKAEEAEKINTQVALIAYQNGLKITKRAKQVDNQARISHKIGQLYYEEGNYQKSVTFQEVYLQLLKNSKPDIGQDVQAKQVKQRQQQHLIALKNKEMEANASLAKCYLKIKNIDRAQFHLNEYNTMAKEAKAQNSVADSSYYLAKLFEQKGDNQKAILYYQSYFEAAKSQKHDKKDRKLVDKARVVFAIAKANKNMDKYIKIYQEDNSLKSVLDWKIKRILK